eukprot:m51a1_g1361 hypothetical protein (510) ;mRNA; f:393058-394748
MRLLCRFAHRHLGFRVPELDAISRLVEVPVSYDAAEALRISSVDPNEETPYLWVDVPSVEAAARIASRSLLIRGFYHVWGEGATYDEMVASAGAWTLEAARGELGDAAAGLRMSVVSFGRKHSASERAELVGRTRSLPLWAAVVPDARSPSPAHKFSILEYYSGDRQALRHVYLGRRVAKGSRGLPELYSLSRREYIGSTSMNPELALIMANQALVAPGSLVYDPFVGTGSLLVACAHFGGLGFGSDISAAVLRGREGPNSAASREGKDVRSNFAQYGLSHRLLDLVALDHSRRPVDFREMLDAIVCDPPYGVRAGARKVGKKERSAARRARDERKAAALEQAGGHHISQCVSYEVPEMLADLLDSAARNLAVGGRLVYWLPSTVDFREEHVPSHPCLRLVSSSLQQITLRWGRRLVTMEKHARYDPGVHTSASAVATGSFVLNRGDAEASGRVVPGELAFDDGTGLAARLKSRKEKKLFVEEQKLAAKEKYLKLSSTTQDSPDCGNTQ